MLGPNWKCLYNVKEKPRLGTFKIESMEGKLLSHPWNVEHLNTINSLLF